MYPKELIIIVLYAVMRYRKTFPRIFSQKNKVKSVKILRMLQQETDILFEKIRSDGNPAFLHVLREDYLRMTVEVFSKFDPQLFLQYFVASGCDLKFLISTERN